MSEFGIFRAPISILHNEVRELGLSRRDFAAVLEADINQDGIYEYIWATTPFGFSGETSQIIINPVFWKTDSGYFSEGYDRIHSIEVDNNIKDPLTMALLDYNQDGLSDLVIRRRTASQTSYEVYINDAEKRAVPEIPALYFVEWLDQNKQLQDSFWPSSLKEISVTRESQTTKVTTTGCFQSLTFHPAHARYAQINDGRLVEISSHEIFKLEQNDLAGDGIPLSYDQQLSITFYDENRTVVAIYLLSQSIPAFEEQTSQEGLRYIASEFPPEVHKDMIPCLDDRIKKVKALWGDKIVDQAAREVVLFNSGLGYSRVGGFGDSPEFFIGQVHVDLGYSFTGEEGQTRSVGGLGFAHIALHEISHNIETYIIDDTAHGLYQDLWQQLVDKNSPVFDFIKDSNYLNLPYKAGHPRDAATETFASMTVVLTAGSEAFVSAWERYQSTHPSVLERYRVKRDFDKLVAAYKQILLQHASNPDLGLMSGFGA